MAELKDQITARLADIDTAIERVESQTAIQIASLEAQKKALQGALVLISPQLEAAVAQLQSMGLLGPIKGR